MHRISYKTTRLAIALAFALAGSVQAQQQQHQQHHPGGPQASQQQPAGTDPGAPMQPQMTEQMQGMMEHMQGMMEHMQGMMSGGSMMARQGMTAQEEDDDEEMSPRSSMMGRRGMMGMGKMMGHGGMIHHHLERLAQQLELSEEQRTQMWSVLGNHAKEAIRLQADLGTLAIDLRQLLEADPVDLAKVKPLLQSIAGKEADLRLLHITAMQEMGKILTPEQRQKLRTIRRGMMSHSGMMGMGGRMSPGGMRGHRPAAQ